MQHNSAKLILREGELRPPSNFVFPAELDWDDHASPGAESDSELLYGVDAHKNSTSSPSGFVFNVRQNFHLPNRNSELYF